MAVIKVGDWEIETPLIGASHVPIVTDKNVAIKCRFLRKIKEDIPQFPIKYFFIKSSSTNLSLMVSIIKRTLFSLL